MSKINLVLRGGLGNQLFQIAAGVFFSKKLQASLIIDDRHIARHKDKSRRSWSRKLDLADAFNFEDISFVNRTAPALLRLGKVASLRKLEVYSESQLIEVTELAKKISVRDWFIKKDYAVKNIYQYEKFRPKKLSRLTQKIECNLLGSETKFGAMHIRLGDYQKMGYSLSDEWYQKSAKKLIKDGIETILVFTDNIDAAKKIISPINKYTKIIFPEIENTLSPIELLWILSNAKFFVSSNSTLSWWSAFLNNKNKTIYSPHDSSLILSSWHHLDPN